MTKRLISTLSNMQTSRLIALPLIIGVLLMFTSMLLLIGSNLLGKFLGVYLLPAAFFVWGSTGLPMIIRREMPWLFFVTGWLAVAEGIILVFSLWGVAIAILVSILRGGG